MKKRRALFSLLFACAVLKHATPLHAGTEVVQPPSGKAIICFYREVAFEGNWFRYGLKDGDTSVGSLPAESFLYYQTTPGDHEFALGLLRHGTTKLNVKRGHIYYLRCDPAPEVAYARPELTLVPVTEGAAVVATLRLGCAAR